MDRKITYNAEAWPLVFNFQILNEIFTKGERLLHWIYKDKKEFIQTILDPNFQFFGLVSLGRESKFLGIGWVYDLDKKEQSVKCGALVWDRISNFEELVQKCFYVFNLKELKAEVHNENNILSKRLLKKLGFTKQDNCYIKEE